MGDSSPLNSLVRTADCGQHYVDEMVSILRREGCSKFAALCIWDNPNLRMAGINYRPPLRYRLLHRYLHATQPIGRSLPIRLIDKALKIITRQ